MKYCLITSMILLLALVAGCDGNVKKAAKYMDDAADAIAIVQDVVIDSEAQGLIDRETHNRIMGATLKANLVGVQIVNILKELDSQGVSEFDPQSRGEILKYLAAANAALDPKGVIEIAGIEDYATRVSIEVGMEAARTTLSALQIMLGGE